MWVAVIIITGIGVVAFSITFVLKNEKLVKVKNLLEGLGKRIAFDLMKFSYMILAFASVLSIYDAMIRTGLNKPHHYLSIMTVTFLLA